MAVAFLAADIIFIDYPMEAHAQTPPTFVSATLDRGTGVLAVTFGTTIDATNIDPTKFHVMEESTSTGGVTLSTAELGTTSDSATVSFTLTAAKLATVNALTSPELTIDPGAVQDTSGTEFAATFDVSTAVFTDSFSVSNEDGNPQGLAFSADGTKMFVVENTVNDVHEYALSTAFDLTGATFTDEFSVSGQDGTPSGLAFSADGTKMFVVGAAGNDVNEYALDTAFDVSTANFTDSFSVSAQESLPTGLAFSANGTKMFVVGVSGDDVNEYALGTAFDVSTATFTDLFSISAQDGFPRDLAFSADGTRMFVVGNDGDDVNEYALGTPFDVSTAVFTDSFSVSDQDTFPAGLAFSADGTKMFVVGGDGNDVNEYALSSAFGITVTGMVSVDPAPTFSSATLNNSTGVLAVTFSETIDTTNIDPTKFHVREESTSTGGVTLSTAELGTTSDSATVSFTLTAAKLATVNALTSPELTIDPGAVQDTSGTEFAATFDVSTAVFTDSFSVSNEDGNPQGLAFSADGTKMFVVENTVNDVHEYALSTAFDLTGATFTDEFSVSGQDGTPSGLAFSADGTKMLVVGAAGNDVNEYALDTAFDVSTANFTDSFSVSAQESLPTGLAFSANGTKMFVVGVSGDDVNEYALGTAFDVSTATFTDSFSISAQDGFPRDLAFSADGTRMFVVGNDGDDVNEYALGTPFDVSTAVFADSFSVSDQDTFPAGLAFSADGDKMFVVGGDGNDVNEYALSSAFDITVTGQANQAPDADAGPDQAVNEGEQVTLDGTDSSDPDGDALSYSWARTGGLPVILNGVTTASPTFTAPDVETSGGSVTLTLTVDDSNGGTDTDTVTITVNNVVANQAPDADAGPDQVVNEGEQVTLDGTDSSDPDGDALSYSWARTGGLPVILNGVTTASPTFTAPDVETSGGSVTLTLTVDDSNGGTDTDTVTITVNNVVANQAPDADAGPDQVVNEGEQVTLDGTDSSDPDGDALSYSWARTGGLPVILNGVTTASPTFTAPDVETSGGSVTLTLTVDDSNGGTDTDTVTITVNNVVANQAPDADAGPDQAVNEGEQVTLDGTDSSDPDGDALSYSWARTGGLPVILNGVTTASPTFTAPDVETSGGSVTLTLTVDDSNGGTDTDTVTITVDDVPPPTGNSPVARAGPDQTVRDRPLYGVTVTLDGSASFDPNPGDTLTYLWEQIRGGTVFLSNADGAVATFTPEMASATPLTFRLTVTDNSAEENTGTDSVTVRIPTQTLTANITADVPVTNSQTVSFGFSFGRDIDRGTLVSAVTATSGTVGAITPSSNAASYDVTVNDLSEGRQTVSIPANTVKTTEGDTFRAASASVTVDLTDPAVSSARVSGTDGITAYFSESVMGTTDRGDWTLSGDTDGITVDSATNPSGRSVTLGLSGDIPNGKPELTLEYTGDDIEDLAGNPLAPDSISVSYPSSGKSRQSSVPVMDIHSVIALHVQSVPKEIQDAAATPHDPDAPIPPILADGTFDFPLEINGYGYLLGGIKNTLEPQTIHVGDEATVAFAVYDRVPIVHFTLYMNLHGADDQYSDSDTHVRYDAGNVQVVDPHGLIESAAVTIQTDGGDKQVITFGITFGNAMEKTNMVARTWNADLSLLTVQVLDAFEVVEAAVEPEPMPAEATALTEPAVEPEPDAEPEPVESTADPKPAAGGFGGSEIQTLKAWGGYSPEYADDAEFLGAFGFQGTTVPDYFRNIAKWFIDGTLDRQTLVNALEYFVAIESWEYPGHAAPESLEDPGSATTATAVLDTPADEMTLQDPDDFDESELRILRAWGIHPPEPVDPADDPNAPIPSIIMDGALDFPISINGYGYLLTGTGNTLEPQTVRVGDETSISFAVYGDMPIEVFTMYLNLHGADDQYYDSDTYVRYDRGSVTVTDPHGLIESAAVTIDADGGNVQVITFGITFADAMDLTHIVARTSDANRSILTMQVLDAFEAVI